MIQQQGRIIEYKKGSSVVIKDSINQGYFFVVMEGSLSLESSRGLSDRKGKFKKGDTFGLVSALTRRPHLSTIFSENDSRVLCIPVSMLGMYLEKERETALRMLQIYSRELRAWHATIAGSGNDNQGGNVNDLVEDAEIYLKRDEPELAAHALEKYLTWAKNNSEQIFKDQHERAISRYNEIKSHKKDLVASDNKIIAAEAGTPIFLEHEPTDFFYIIQQGRVKITKLISGEEHIVDILGPGEIFGEMAVLENKPRMGSAITVVDSVVMRLPPKTFLAEVGAPVLQKMFGSLARRIWVASMKDYMRNIGDPLGRLYYYLGVQILSENSTSHIYRKKVKLPFGMNELISMAGLPGKKDVDFPEMLRDRNLTISPSEIEIQDTAILVHTITQYDRGIRKYFDPT